MSIKILRQGLPVTGYAKIGARSKAKKGAPEKFDHIELTGVERDKDGVLCPDIDLMLQLLELGAPTCGGCARSKFLAQQYEKPVLEHGLPTEIEIALPYDDPELFFPHRLAYHRGGTAFCVGDGETAQRLEVKGKKKVGDKQVDVYGPAVQHSPCGPECTEFESRRCKPQAKLRFMLEHQRRVGGCFEFKTTSWNSIANLVNGLEMIQTTAAGVIRWLPVKFGIMPQTVVPKGGGPPNTAYIAYVEYDGTHQELIEKVENTLKLRAPIAHRIQLIEAGVPREQWTETEEEIQADREEFDPDNLHAEGDVILMPGPAEQPEAQTPEAQRASVSEPGVGLGEATPESAPTEPREKLPAPDCTCPEGEPAPDCLVHGEVTDNPLNQQPNEAAETESEQASVETISLEQKRALWNACKARSAEFEAKGMAVTKETAGLILRQVLESHEFECSDDIPDDDFQWVLTTAKNCKFPEAA